MVYLILKSHCCLEKMPHIKASLWLNKIMNILEEPPQAVHLIEGKVNELECGCQREAVTSLL